MFTIKDFDIDVSPKGISEMLNGKTTTGEKSGCKVINEKGESINFDEKIFSQKYLKRGMPRGTIVTALSSVLENAYDGITLLELRRLFKQELDKKVASVTEVFKQIEDDDKHKRTFAHLLSIVHPEALDMHANGDIFIKNLREPKLLNFVHDLRGVVYHGAGTLPPENITELFEQAIRAIKDSSDYVMGVHAFDAFNYFVAPLAKDAKHLKPALKSFFDALAQINAIFFINLDAGLPRYAEHYFAMLKGKGEFYKNYQVEAKNVFDIVLEILRSQKYKNIIAAIKIWDKKITFSNMQELNEFVIINATNEKWENACFIGNTIFDSSWRGVQRTSRIGELQNISINARRIAFKTKSEDKFIEEFKKILQNCAEYHLNMMELSVGEFLRKYKISYKTKGDERWPYVAVNDCVYSFSLVGMEHAAEILGTNKENLAKKVKSATESALAKYSQSPIRFNVKDIVDSAILNRHNHLDEKYFGIRRGKGSSNLSNSACLPKKDFNKYASALTKLSTCVRFV